MATSPQVVSTAQKSQAESVSSNSLSKAGGATLSSANMAIVGSQPVSSAGLKVNEEISSEGMKLSNEMLSAQEELKPVTSLETKQEVIGRKAFTLATEEEKTEENKLDEAKKVSAITSVSGKEEMITPDKNLLVAPQKASLTKEVTGIQKVETPKAEAEKVTLPTTDSKSLTAPAKAKISGTAASATKTVSEPVKSLSQQSQTGKKDTLNSNTLTAPQAPAKALQKNSFWLDETSPMTLKVAQIDTLTFADEADSNQSPEELSEAVGETFLPKEGEGDSVEEIKRAKESMQEFMRNEVTALYATGFTIRTNMMKEPENRDVDMENENQMWKETILKAEDCITRIAKIHVMEAMLSSYRYSEALQDLVVQQTESLESEEE